MDLDTGNSQVVIQNIQALFLDGQLYFPIKIAEAFLSLLEKKTCAELFESELRDNLTKIVSHEDLQGVLDILLSMQNSMKDNKLSHPEKMKKIARELSYYPSPEIKEYLESLLKNPNIRVKNEK
jgi:isocitrate dehydrogenase kinase/phosphatase